MTGNLEYRFGNTNGATPALRKGRAGNSNARTGTGLLRHGAVYIKPVWPKASHAFLCPNRAVNAS
jgi:hypothetical protein